MSIREAIATLIVLVLLTVLHNIIGNNVFSFAPLPLILSVVIAQLAKNKFKFLLLLALIAELYSYFPPGIMTAIVLTPWALQRISKKIQPDISPYFILIVALSISLQTVLAFGYEIIYLLVQDSITFSQIYDVIPFTSIIMIIGVSTLTATIVCVAWREIFPVDANGSAIFTRRKKFL